MNPNNCAHCVHKVEPPNGAHCWRLRNEPTGKCNQWTANRLPINTPVRRIGLERG